MISHIRKLPSPRSISPLQRIPRTVNKIKLSPNNLKQYTRTPVSYFRAASSCCYVSAYKQNNTRNAIVGVSPIKSVVRKLEWDNKEETLHSPTRKNQRNGNKLPTIEVTEEQYDSDNKLPTVVATEEQNSQDNIIRGTEEQNERVMLFSTPKYHQILCHGVKEINRRITLGRGSFGTVVKARHKGSEVAVKVVPTKRFQKSLHSLWNEKNAIKLSHPNIVKVLQVVLSEPEHGLVFMEICHGQDLQVLINDPEFPINNIRRIRYGLHIAEALRYCHDNKVLHLDVKPCNVMVHSNCDTCKLCDFGSSCTLDQRKNTVPNLSTVVYTDPNIFKGEQPTQKSDIYSLGVVLWQLLTREDPYKGYNVHAVIFQVGAQKLRPTTTKVMRKIYHDYVALYEQCWHENSQQRPKSDSVAQQLHKILMLYKTISHL